MALIKVKSTWTQVPNTWLKDKNLSLKAKGLLAVMQSLPDGWDFSVMGLTTILNDGLTAVRSAVQEIETAGYLIRTQVRNEQGKIADTIWTLYETPQVCEKPSVENPPVDGAIQLNTKKENTKKRERVDSAKASSTLPFSVDVSKSKDNSDGVVDCKFNNKKEFAFCNDLLTLMNLPGIKPGVKLRSAVRARLKEGYSELDLRAIARWSATQTDSFYRTPHSLFSEAGVAGALALIKEEKPKFTTMRTI